MFQVGDEVVCINDAPGYFTPIPGTKLNGVIEVKAGLHYIVRWCGVFKHPCYANEFLGARLVGVVRGPCRKGGKLVADDTPFSAIRFRPVRRESIELFRQMCVSKKPLIPVE